ncbi:MAG: alpha/beta hydrolase-fold protein, partial [Bacteroidales bacterium]|nr:alpha/beta hydrolase-fold protein [Bacteroidales bacterium]
MNRIFVILGFLMLSLQIFAVEDGSRIIESLEMQSSILGQKVKYSVYLPAGYDATENDYPVVYLLHGLGDNETAWVEYGRIAQIADIAIAKKEIVPMIFVIPQGFRTYYVNFHDGSFNYQDMFVQELIPFIESKYRVLKDKQFRGTLGYSMGGFGALILPLKHPDVFSACVPLSISVRTDAQYMTEDPEGWNEQWGKIFGGAGTFGEERITEYYKKNSPFHIFADAESGAFEDLKIYIDNGDDEQTLAFSNEELHILMRDRNIPHEFRVRNGGHSFSYWRESVDNGLQFLSDAFENKPYRGDKMAMRSEVHNSESSLKKIEISGHQYELFTPEGYETSSRLYPVLYFFADFQNSEKQQITEFVNHKINEGSIPPVMILFAPVDEKKLLGSIIPAMEKDHKARAGFRFRALIGIEGGGKTALEYAMNPEQFTACAIFDASFDFESFNKVFSAVGPKALERTWFFIDSPDKGMNYFF